MLMEQFNESFDGMVAVTDGVNLHSYTTNIIIRSTSK
jgi:hypothetical protein